MTTINVPQPGIYRKEDRIYYSDDALVGKRAQLHELHLSPINLQDGTVLARSDIASAYFLFTRYDFESTGVVEKIWSTSNKKWDMPANIPDKDRDKNVLQFTDDATYPWKGQFVLIAEEGKFESPPEGQYFPKYTLQCHFTSRPINNRIYAGKSAPSVRIMMGTFPPVFKARLEIKPEDNTNSDYIRIVGDGVGYVRITRTSSEILISHDNGSEIKLDNSGNISLTPSGSGRVNVTGDIAVAGDIAITGDVNISGSLTVNGHVII